MGRTLPTYRNLLEDELERWNAFRKALRKKDQETFDELMNMCRDHASASSYLASTNPFETMAMSMFLELYKSLDAIKKELEELRSR